jgi:hypothetical protein
MKRSSSGQQRKVAEARGVTRGAAPDPLRDLPADVRVPADKARRWWTGVMWATTVGYGAAWLIGSKFSALGWAVFSVAIAVQVSCFALWWHYMDKMDRAVDAWIPEQGTAHDWARGKGWLGFAKRHPSLFGIVLFGVLMGGIIVVAFALDR